MPDDISTQVGAFLDQFWENEKGRVYIAALKESKKDSFQQFFPRWPLDRQKVISAVVTLSSTGADVFFCPAVFKEDAPKPERQYVASVNSHWLDFDGNAPSNWEVAAKEKGVPEPSQIIQSSVKGQQHVYWFTERASDPQSLDAAENITRNLTAAFATDKAGWDLNQLLRVPGTKNYGWKREGEHKAWYGGEPATVTIIKQSNEKFAASVFSNLTNAERKVLERIHIGEVPPIGKVLALAKWSEEMFDHFNMTAEQASEASPNKRSGSLQRLAYYGAENGLTDDQIYAVLDDADMRWGKYIHSHSKAGRDKILRDSIARARTKIGYLVGEDISLSGIMAEVSTPLTSAPKFVYNYQEFLEAEFKMDWLLDKLIPVSGFGLIVGQPGAGKTRLAIQLALELASGRERVLCWNNSTGPKKVGLLSLEMAGDPLSQFIKAYAEFYEKDSLALSRNFHIVPLGAEVHLDRPEGQALIKNYLSEYKEDLLIIDSLQMSISKPMTDELAMKALTKFVSDVRQEYSTAIVFIHHERKRSSDRLNAGSELSDIYGSQMLNAAIDFAVSLNVTGTYTTMNEIKNRLALAKRDVHLVGDGIRFVLSEPDTIIQEGFSGYSSEGHNSNLDF